MTPSILIVLGILSAAVLLFVTEALRVDLVALLVLLALGVSGILEPEQAIAGFSNEAVITIASVLILSGGLMRTGVAHRIGRQVLHVAGRSPTRLVPLLMITVGLLSGFMNDIGVTALMLPAVLEIARRIAVPPSKLLMPLAFGSLLGGMTTLIGTAPNILIASALRDAGYESFGMFDFTPLGLAALAVGVVYMSLVGRHLLPERDPRAQAAGNDLEEVYQLDKVLGALTVPEDSHLAGRSLAQSRLGHTLGLNVVAVKRAGQLHLAPGPDFVLRAQDELLTEGPLDRFETLRAWRHLVIEPVAKTLERISGADFDLPELDLGPESPGSVMSVQVPAESRLAGLELSDTSLATAFDFTVLAILRDDSALALPEGSEALAEGDTLLLRGRRTDLALVEALRHLEVSDRPPPGFVELESELVGLVEVALSPRTSLAGQRIAELEFRERYGVSIVAIWRDGSIHRSGLAQMELRLGDAFLVYGDRRRLAELSRDPEFYVLSAQAQAPPRQEKAPVSALIMGGVLLSVVLGLAPISLAAPAGALLMVLTRCLSIEEAYRSIELKAVVLIAGMLSLGLAMQETGAAELLAEKVLGSLAVLGERPLIAGLFLLTAVAAQVMPTAAVAVVMAPIALRFAESEGLSPQALLMVLAIGSSCAFMSPVGHAVNLLVMGFGGYRFTDYAKVGLPLTLILMALVVFLLPVIWPL